MLLTDKQFRFYFILMIILLLPTGIILLSDASMNLNKNSSKPLRGYQNVRTSTSFLKGGSKNSVLLVEGFCEDQVVYKSMRRELRTSGWSTLSFDFAGQGRSWGTLSIDNDQRDRQARELEVIEKSYLENFKLDKKYINYVGHGHGAKALLEATSQGWINPSNLILIGPFINEKTATQAWFKKLQKNSFNFPITIIRGGLDDLCTVKVAQQIKKAIELSPNFKAEKVQIITLPGITHTFELQSASIIKATRDALEKNYLASDSILPIYYPILRSLAIIFSLLALLIIPAMILFQTGKPSEPMIIKRSHIILQSIGWIAGIPLATLIGTSIWFLPVGKPLIILTFPLLIGAPGFVKWLFYQYSPKKWGFSEMGAFPKLKQKINSGQRLESFRIGAILATFWMIILVLTTRLALFYTIPLNAKQFWLWIIITLSFPGFYSASLETLYFQKNAIANFIMGIIRWSIFLILPVSFFMVFGITATVSQIMHLILLAIILLMGRVMLRLEVSPIQTAFSQAFIYSIILLPQSAMIQ